LSQNFRILLSSVSLILLGILADHFLISELGAKAQIEDKDATVASTVNSGAVSCSKEDPELQALKQKFAGVSENEIREYLRTTNAEDKLRRADEMLGKMMQIFITDLGYKISQPELDQLGKPLESSKAIDTQPSAKSEVQVGTVPTPARDFKRRNVQFFNVRTEEQAQDFIKAAAQSDFTANLKASKNLTDEMAKQLSGRFAGTITFSGDRTPLKAEMSFEGSVRRGELRGRHDIQLINSKTGKATSHSRGSGSLDRSYQINADAYIIEVGGDYLELYYFPALDELMGYYLEITKGDFIRTGSVRMKRI
jgi:hypothetical protein